MLSALSSREIGMTEIEIEHLNYGKLTVGDNRRVPSSEGYGVTRCSRGLAQFQDGSFLPARLLDIKKFERELIDEQARKEGGLFLRTSAGHDKAAIMRARFRAEDGEDGTGRPYLQSTVWVLSTDDWAKDPADILAEAAKSLRATPDLQSEAAGERMRAEPFRRDIVPQYQPDAPLSGAARKIIGTLLLPTMQQEDDEDRQIFFGNGDFAGEAEFLAAVGQALARIGPTFARWNEICVASGLHHEAKGLFIRYVPSGPANQSDDVSEQEVLSRIKRWTAAGRRPVATAAYRPLHPKPASKEITFGKSASPDMAQGRPVEPPAYVAPLLQPEVQTHSARADDDLDVALQLLSLRKQLFSDALAQYRAAQIPYSQTPHSINWQSDAANHLLEVAWEVAKPDLSSQGVAALQLNENDGEILKAFRYFFASDFRRMHLGALFDIAMLFRGATEPPSFPGYAKQIFTALGDRLRRLVVLLPDECTSLRGANVFTQMPADEAKALLQNSMTLKGWLTLAKIQKSSRINTTAEQARVLKAFGARFPNLFNMPFHLDGDDTFPTGIHRKCVVNLEAILTPGQYGETAHDLLRAMIPQYVMSL
jgi:hypothetical protein